MLNTERLLGIRGAIDFILGSLLALSLGFFYAMVSLVLSASLVLGSKVTCPGALQVLRLIPLGVVFLTVASCGIPLEERDIRPLPLETPSTKFTETIRVYVDPASLTSMELIYGISRGRSSLRDFGTVKLGFFGLENLMGLERDLLSTPEKEITGLPEVILT